MKCFLLIQQAPYTVTRINQVANFMEQSPSSEANRSSAGQKIPLILCSLEGNYRIHKCRPAVPNLSQSNPVHASSSHIFKIRFNIILPSMPTSSKWSPSFGPSHRNLVTNVLTFLKEGSLKTRVRKQKLKKMWCLVARMEHDLDLCIQRHRK
jgi:hypothetical protein